MLLSLIRKTIRDHLRSVLGWGLGLAALTVLQLAVYPSIKSQGVRMRDLIDSYPSAFKAMFGMEGVDFTTGPGYLSTETFSLLAPLMLIGLAIALGAGAIASEEERGSLDLLMASPVSRGRVLAAKALGSLAAVVAAAVVFYLTVLAAETALDMGVSPGMLAEATTAVLVLACCCGGVAFLAGTLLLSDTLRANFDRLFTQADGGTDVVLRGATEIGSGNGARTGVDASLLAPVRSAAGVADAQPYLEGYGQLLGRDGKPIGGLGPRGVWRLGVGRSKSRCDIVDHAPRLGESPRGRTRSQGRKTARKGRRLPHVARGVRADPIHRSAPPL